MDTAISPRRLSALLCGLDTYLDFRLGAYLDLDTTLCHIIALLSATALTQMAYWRAMDIIRHETCGVNYTTE